jgi:uncharacterized protein (TIGR03437 family)
VGKLFFLYLCGAVALISQGATTVTVTATPTALTFTYQSGAATLPAAQSVSVKASAGAPTYTPTTPGTDQWVTVSPNSGTLPASLSVRVNPTSLAVGMYSSTVTVTVSGVASPLSVPLTLTVTEPPSTLTLSASSLSFVAPLNPPAPQTLTLTTNGAPISYTASSGATWMTVTPTVGVALPGDPVTLTVSVNATTLAPQSAPYTAKITVVASGAAVTAKSQNVTVTFAVNSTTPTITSLWPGTLPLSGPAQTITILGTNFYSATLAEVQGVTTPLTTTILSQTALLAVVPAALLTAAGNLNILVANPAPGGNSPPFPLAVASIPTITGVLNAASYAAAALSPGELITIFGTNIGPVAPAGLSIVNGYATTVLGNVTVTIDGQAAPLIYVSQNQISAQVPYEVISGVNLPVIVTNGANPAASALVTIGTTAPGIFTADGSGTGQAAALNFNSTTNTYSLNGTAAPCPIGDTILLYLTGEGNYNPLALSGILNATNTGYIIPSTLNPLPQVNPLPTVMIGGAPATVSYAGPLVGSILGLLQMNVVIPGGSATGASVPVIVTIGGTTTQANITLNVHP